MVAEVKDEVVWERLRAENEEFQRWEQEHNMLEKSLEELTTHPYLTPEEEAEEKRIKKLKLMAKDKMMEIIRQFKVAVA